MANITSKEVKITVNQAQGHTHLRHVEVLSLIHIPSTHLLLIFLLGGRERRGWFVATHQDVFTRDSVLRNQCWHCT